MTATTVKFIGLDDFKSQLDRMDAAVRGKALKQAVLAAGQVVEAQAKINANETFSEHATNNLAGSINTVITEEGQATATAAVGSNAVHARIHELGGVIKPVNATYLHFTTYDGTEVFTKSVTMPARPYLRPAADESEEGIKSAAGYVLKQAIEGAK